MCSSDLAADDATVAADMDRMRTILAEIGAAGGTDALAILADEGAPDLLVNPARPWDDRSLALDAAGWAVLGRRLETARLLAADHGLRTSFHPHISTYVESPWEVERVLDASPIGLTLDTGHFLLAGAEPREALTRFGDRVDHVHLKDVRVDVLRRAKAEGRTDFDAWWGDVSVRLGEGDVAMTGFVADLVRRVVAGEDAHAQDHLADFGRLIADPKPTHRLEVLDHLEGPADVDVAMWLKRLSHDTSPAVRSAAARAMAWVAASRRRAFESASHRLMSSAVTWPLNTGQVRGLDAMPMLS